MPQPTVPLSPSPSPAAAEPPLLSPAKPPDSPLTPTPTPTPSAQPSKGIQLLPFASKPGEGNALIVPPPGRALFPEESKKSPGPPFSPQTTPTKSPGKRGAGKDSPKSSAPLPTPPPPIMVCLTVQNLPLDHASMCRMAFEEAPPPPPPVTKRPRGRPRTTSLSQPPSYHPLREEEEGEEGSEQRLRLREQLGASTLLQLASAPTADLSVLADIALKMDPDAGDSEETETSDEAEEQKMEEDLFFSMEPLALVMDPEGLTVLMEHNYSKPPVLLAPASKRTSSKQDSSVLLPADLNTISGVLEAPEEVIGEALLSRGDTGDYLSGMSVLCESEDVAKATALPPSSKRKGVAGKGFNLEKDKSKKRRRKDKENVEVQHTKKQKERPGKKQRKRKLEVRGTRLRWFLLDVCGCLNHRPVHHQWQGIGFLL